MGVVGAFLVVAKVVGKVGEDLKQYGGRGAKGEGKEIAVVFGYR